MESSTPKFKVIKAIRLSQFSMFLSLTLHCRIDERIERHLLVLDLRTRTWKELNVATIDLSANNIYDIKHRIDGSNSSVLLIMNEAHKFTNKTVIHRIAVW